MADALQVIEQHLLLRQNLFIFGQVLQHAAAAGAEMRATRLHAVGRCAQHLDGGRFIEMPRTRGLFRHHPLAGQRAGHEDRFACVAIVATATGNAAAIVAEGQNLKFERGLVDAGHGWVRCEGEPDIVAADRDYRDRAKRNGAPLCATPRDCRLCSVYFCFHAPPR